MFTVIQTSSDEPLNEFFLSVATPGLCHVPPKEDLRREGNSLETTLKPEAPLLVLSRVGMGHEPDGQLHCFFAQRSCFVLVEGTSNHLDKGGDAWESHQTHHVPVNARKRWTSLS